MDDKTAKPEEKSQPARQLPLDTKLLSEVVIELNISRKNVGIYPPGHIQIARSIDRAFEMLQRLFEVRAEMTLGVGKDTLFVGQDYLDRQNPVYRDFALSLYNQGIAAVTFISGLDRPQLERFHRIITTKPEEIKATGGIVRAVGDAELPQIRIVPLDFGSFHLTEEQEIAHRKTAPEPGLGLWGDFVSHLSAGTIAVPGVEKGVSLKDAEQVDPAELAQLLNQRKIDPNLAVETYDRIISSHVRTRSEQRTLTREQSDTLRSLNSLMKDLHPDLRKQFLAVTYQNTTDASPAVTEEVIGGLTDDMVIEMLQQASAEGREISPTLTGVLSKLSSAGGQSSGSAARTGQQAAPLTQEQVQALFKREQYETYVSNEYDDVLKRLAGGTSGPSAVPAGTFPVDEYVASMTEEKLDYQIGRVLLGFIDEEIDDEDYSEFLKKIIGNVPELVKTQQFALLHDTYEMLRLHGREKKSLAVRTMVDMALATFRDPPFIQELVDAFGSCSDRELAKTAGRFLLALGQDALPPLLDLYSEKATAGGRRQLFDLLCRFGNSAIAEAVKRLNDPRPEYVRNLVMLVRWGWDASVVPQLRPLVKHRDWQVRIEALTALLRFRDGTAAAALRSAIRSDDADEAAQAIALAGQFRVRSVVDEMLAKIKKVILFESDYRDNEEIIRALGEIGDARVLPELERIAAGGWPLFPKSRDRMKAVLFETLERYPPASIQGLVALGEKTNDPRILRSCRKLKERT